MPLLGRLPKSSSGVDVGGVNGVSAQPSASPNVFALPTQQGAQLEVNNALQLVDRLELSSNTRAKVQQSIALNIGKGGNDVLANAQAEMAKFKQYRDGVLNAFAAQGAEAPPELLTRLGELERTTGQRISYQMMRPQEQAQLASSFNGGDLQKREFSTMLEIDDFVRPVTTAKAQLEFQQNLIKTSQARATLDKTQTDTRITKRKERSDQATGALDSLYPNVSAGQIEKILSSRSYRALGISDVDAGRWGRDKIKSSLDNAKLRAEIDAKRASTSASNLTRRTKQLDLQKQTALRTQSDGFLQALGDKLASEGGTYNLAGIPVTADDVLKVRDSRLKAGEKGRELDLEIIDGAVASTQFKNLADRADLVTEWFTGDTSNSVSSQATLQQQVLEEQIVKTFPEGIAREQALARLRKEIVEQFEPLAENATENFMADAPDYEKALVEEYQRAGSLELTQNATRAIADDPGFARLVADDSPYKGVANAFTDMANQGFEAGGVDATGNLLTSPFNPENSNTEIVDFLERPYIGADGEETGMTNELVLRRMRHGSMQGAATAFKVEALYDDEIGGQVLQGNNREGVPVFNSAGQISEQFLTPDFEVNYLHIMMELHAANPNNGVNAISDSVAKFMNVIEAGPSRLGINDEESQRLEVAFAKTKQALLPQGKSEALLSALTNGTLNQVISDEQGNTRKIGITADQDINIAATRTLRVNALKAYDEYQRQIFSLDNRADITQERANRARDNRLIRGEPERFSEPRLTQGTALRRELDNLINEAKAWSPNPLEE